MIRATLRAAGPLTWVYERMCFGFTTIAISWVEIKGYAFCKDFGPFQLERAPRGLFPIENQMLIIVVNNLGEGSYHSSDDRWSKV